MKSPDAIERSLETRTVYAKSRRAAESSVAVVRSFDMTELFAEGMKRTVQVKVKMTQEDTELLKKAAEKRWPDAVMTNSGIVPALRE